MSKKKPTAKPAQTQALPPNLSLADIVVTWHDGEKEHLIEGEYVALALRMAYRRINDGMGTWEVFTNLEAVTWSLQGVEQLLQAAMCADEPLTEGVDAVGRLVAQARIQCELVAYPVRATDYRIQIGQVERTPRVLGVVQPTQAA